MPPAPTSPDEITRLDTLKRYAVADILSDKAFDEITALAAQICSTPAATISIVDAQRQWSMSRLGFAPMETARHVSFCSHAILQKDILIVPDATRDKRFADNPLVLGEPYIRFYAGMPLVTSAGMALGALCVLDSVPRELDDQQKQALRVLSRQVIGQMELRRHVRELESSEAGRSTILESALDGIIIINHEGRILEFNPAAEKIFDYTRAEVVGKPLASTVIPPDQRETYRKGLGTYLRTGQAPIIGERIEINAMRSDGSLFPVELSVVCSRRSAPPVFIGFVRDITERKRLEEQLRHSQKMEGIGQLASGIAHDFNNLLTVIQGNASLLALGDSGELVTESAQQIVQAAERAAGLTRQLLLFSRKQLMQQAELDLNRVVGNMTKMLHRILGEDIALTTELAPKLPLVRADSGMIEQVLLNLAVNSRDAMPTGGSLKISTSAETVNERQAQQNPEATPGPCVCLRVSDSGSGIPPEILPRVFEPFFTTKEVGKGTGLGLATVYGIVKQHRGWLAVDSKRGEGATIRVYLPAIDGQPVDAEAEAHTLKLPGGKETVLVVEDEPAVRQFTSHVLRLCGYTVLVAASGVDALELWKERKDDIDLVVTDMIMPNGMTGRQLVERLRSETPDIKVIFTSGYSTDVAGEGSVLGSGASFLHKPYPAGKLAEIVRNRLDRK
jgi:two-component system, cell cycle sensor histidine kinase and response regulator CckA